MKKEKLITVLYGQHKIFSFLLVVLASKEQLLNEIIIVFYSSLHYIYYWLPPKEWLQRMLS